MEIIKDIPFVLDELLLMQKVHIRPASYDVHEFKGLVDLVRETGKPKAVYSEAYLEINEDSEVFLNGIRFSSSMLRTNLSTVEKVFPFIVTCGCEMDQYTWDDDNLLKQYWWDTIKASLLMSAYQYLHQYLEGRYLLRKTSTMSPGSGDIEVWPLEQQRELFQLLGDVQGQIGVILTESCLMIPNKTISGILFPTEKDFRTCQVCHRENCPSRSAPFDQELWASIQPS
jgi:hypothetical protein